MSRVGGRKLMQITVGGARAAKKVVEDRKVRQQQG